MPIKDPIKRKEYMKTYGKTHYDNNKEAYRNKNRKLLERNKVWFNEYKATLKCSFCKEHEPCCLDFHHIDKSKKDYEISKIAHNYYAIKTIKKEISKCIVVCKNCHAKLHHYILNKT
jgi:hypothetical protein